MKNLTIRYSITQFAYWASASGAVCFATAYLLGRGLPSGLLGVFWAVSGILSCFVQPVLASFADRSEKFIVPTLAQVLLALCVLCFGAQMLPGLPLIPASCIYFLGVCCSNSLLSLVNALSVGCIENGYQLNYGLARGLGSVASATAAMFLGHIIAKFGDRWLFSFSIVFSLICMICMASFPKLQKVRISAEKSQDECNVLEFFLRYKWYCISLLGVACVCMFHSMSENYMIAIMQNLGGDSRHVGTAIFISSMSAAAVIAVFSFFRKRLKDTLLIKIACVAFLLKAVLFCFARSASDIYLFQLLNSISFGFLTPVIVFYADAKVHAADMVKGQAFAAGSFALGCAGGDFVGGQLLAAGTDIMLHAGVVMVLVGTVILFLTVEKTDQIKQTQDP